MSLVNQRHCLIAVLLQFPLYKLKIEDLVTIRNTLFIFIHGSFTHTHSIGSIDPIKKIMFRNLIIQFFNLKLILGYKSRECIFFLEFFIER